MYDFLIVGAGLFGSTFARLAVDNGYKVLVIDQRDHIGGNCYDKNINGINCHMYGPHIFHTSYSQVWDFVNRFADFNNFVNSPIAINGNEVFSLPFNMYTFNKMWGVKTPHEAMEMIGKQTNQIKGRPKNLEEHIISMVGADLYKKLIKDYTEKQWGRSCKDLPLEIIERIPIRFTYNNNYYNSRWQGIPKEGYTKMFEKMLQGVPVALSEDFFSMMEYWKGQAKKVVYSGQIDRFYNYEYGQLEYRTLDFMMVEKDTINFQGNAVVNYTGADKQYTRVIEHKFFNNWWCSNTIISYETPREYVREKGDVPYYPIPTERNKAIYEKYEEKAKQEQDIIFGGRLAEYKYLDMDETILSAINKFNALKVDRI